MGWEQRIIDAIQLGGKIVFLKENAPPFFETLIRGFQRDFAGIVPFSVLKSDDVDLFKIKTNPQDLIIVFSTQVQLLEKLNSRLQGQRCLLWEGESFNKTFLVDEVWLSFCLADWVQMWTTLIVQIKTLKTVTDFERSFQASCLFLDRDDVIVKNVPYNKDPEKVELMEGIESLISRAHGAQYWVAMVTNQSGLGRGRIRWDEYKSVHQKTLQMLAQKGCWLDECMWATFIDESPTDGGRLYPSLRKPRPGMFQIVQQKLKINMKTSIMVGDSASDLIAAFSAGVGKLYLLHSEKIDKENQSLELFAKDQQQFEYKTISKFEEVLF